MPGLFTARSNAVLRGVLVIGIASVIALPCALWLWMRTPFITSAQWPIAQPIRFDHRHHVRDVGIDCLYCHSEAERSSTAGIPSTALCMGCHGQIWPDGISLAPLRESWASGAPIVWQRVHDLPDFVFFDHAIHLHKGIGCVSCHGRVDTMAHVYQSAPLTMGWCLDCHRDPQPHLRPRASITAMDRAPDPAQQPALAQLHRVESETHCTVCHR